MEEETEHGAADEAGQVVEADGWKIQRPPRAKLTPEEVLKRMQEFESKRRDTFIAAVRKTKS